MPTDGRFQPRDCTTWPPTVPKGVMKSLGPVERSGDIYTPEEIAQLGAVSRRCSEVLLRLAD